MPHYYLQTTRAARKGSAPPTLSYFTTFSLTENPVSEGSNWKGGLSPGLDWNNIQTGGGFAYSSVDAIDFHDCTGILTDPQWSNCPNQHIRATARTINQNPGKYQELELRFRSAVSAHSCTGYELFWKCAHDGSQYIALVRWDGPFGNLSSAQPTAGSPFSGPGIVDGDVLDGYLRGNIVSAYINGVFQTSWDITTAFNGGEYWINSVPQGDRVGNGTVYTSGAPGLGIDEGITGSTLTDWGFYDFLAESL